MPDTTQSANMGLELPNVSQATGPQWATNINSALSQIDQHNHSPSQGVPIPSVGININSDLPFGENNATQIRTVRFNPSTATSGTDARSISVAGDDLFYRDGVGRRIQITQSGSLLGASGNITGLVLPAVAEYVPGTATFVFTSSATVPANIDGRNHIVRSAVPGANGVTIASSASTDAWTMTLPNNGGTNGFGFETAGAGRLSFVPKNDSQDILNYSLSASVVSNTLVVSLNSAAGTAPSLSDPVYISFRNATSGAGTSVVRPATSGTSITLGNGSSLGHASGVNEYIYAYALDNAGRVELGLVGGAQVFDDGSILSSTAEGTGNARSRYTMYSTSARSVVPARLLGRFASLQSTSGVWATVPSEISLRPFSWSEKAENSYVALDSSSGYASSGPFVKIRRYSQIRANVGTAITYNASSAAIQGAWFTINEDGLYSIVVGDGGTNGGTIGISLNASGSLATNVQSLPGVMVLAVIDPANGFNMSTNAIRRLRPGDIIRPHGNGVSDGTSLPNRFEITKLSG